MKIFIDSEYKCHTTNPDGFFDEIDVPFFDDKCTEFIEGYRVVPYGKSWIREDGEVFEGELIAPFLDYSELDAEQRIYEQQKLAENQTALADAENALAILLGGKTT